MGSPPPIEELVHAPAEQLVHALQPGSSPTHDDKARQTNAPSKDSLAPDSGTQKDTLAACVDRINGLEKLNGCIEEAHAHIADGLTSSSVEARIQVPSTSSHDIASQNAESIGQTSFDGLTWPTEREVVSTKVQVETGVDELSILAAVQIEAPGGIQLDEFGAPLSEKILPAPKVLSQESSATNSVEHRTLSPIGENPCSIEKSKDGGREDAEVNGVSKEASDGSLPVEAMETELQVVGEDDRQVHEIAKATHHGASADLIGRPVTKRFGRKKFRGVIDSYDAENKWYKVVYDDGDEEDLERMEVEVLIVPPSSSRKRLHPGNSEEREDKRRKEVAGSPRKKGLLTLSSKRLSKGKTGGSNASNLEERRRSGTGITLQEGIKRFLEKCEEDVGQSSTKRKDKLEQRGVRKVNLAKFGMTEEVKTPVPESSGKLAALEDGRGSGASLVGAPTLKKFGKKMYAGVVVRYNKKNHMYLVRYEDGDEEDLIWKDLEPTLASVDDQERGSIGKEKWARLQVGTALVGTPTRKKFGRKSFGGTVISYDKERQYYKVKYEDGDMEDLEWDELEPNLLLELLPDKTPARLSSEKLGSDTMAMDTPQGHRKETGKSKRSPGRSRREDGDVQEAVIGHSTRKKFGRKFNDGEEVGYETQTKLYRVRYEDGDEEDLAWSDLKPTLTLTGQQQGKASAVQEQDTPSAVKGITYKRKKKVKEEDTPRGSSSKAKKGSESKARLIGHPTRKRFGRKLYNGTVVSFDKKTELYKVKYVDGDEEYLEWSELEPTLVVE